MFKKIMDKFQKQVKKDSQIIQEHKAEEKERQNKTKVKTFAPKSKQEVEAIAKAILSGVICHVNFNKFSENEKRQYLFFILGVVYATKSDTTKVDNDQFIFTPKEK